MDEEALNTPVEQLETVVSAATYENALEALVFAINDERVDTENNMLEIYEVE